MSIFADKLAMNLGSKFLAAVLLGNIFFVGFACASEELQEQGVVHNGVVFNIAKDRKIEKIGGIYEPEGVDKYVQRKLQDTNARIDKLDERIADNSQKLDQILKEISKLAPQELQREDELPQ